jgi:hypothetical protein
MAKAFGSQLDLQKIPVLNIVVQQMATPGPATPSNGQLWYDTTNNQLKAWVNGVWVQCDNISGSAPGGPAGGDLTGTYPNPTIGVGKVTSAAILDGAVAMVDLNADTKDQPNATSSLRKLGLATLQAMPGTTDLSTISGTNAAIGPVGLNGQKITNLADPTNPQDAATKNYVDLTAQGLDAKASVKVASTANLGLTGLAAIDGVTPIAGDRVLAKDQTTQSANGIYVAASGAWTRATDMDAWTEVPGAYTFVEQGTTNADSGWLCTSDQGGTLGTTAITWVQFSGAGQITAGAGLTKTGNTIDVIGANAISVAPDVVSLLLAGGGASGLVQSGSGLSILPKPNTGLTTDTSGVYIMLKSGGGILVDSTGLYLDTTVITRKYAALVAALTAGTPLTITHNLNTQDVHVQFQDATTRREVVLDWAANAVNTIQVTADISYAANALRVTVVG